MGLCSCTDGYCYLTAELLLLVHCIAELQTLTPPSDPSQLIILSSHPANMRGIYACIIATACAATLCMSVLLPAHTARSADFWLWQPTLVETAHTGCSSPHCVRLPTVRCQQHCIPTSGQKPMLQLESVYSAQSTQLLYAFSGTAAACSHHPNNRHQALSLYQQCCSFWHCSSGQQCGHCWPLP